MKFQSVMELLEMPVMSAHHMVLVLHQIIVPATLGIWDHNVSMSNVLEEIPLCQAQCVMAGRDFVWHLTLVNVQVVMLELHVR